MKLQELMESTINDLKLNVEDSEEHSYVVMMSSEKSGFDPQDADNKLLDGDMLVVYSNFGQPNSLPFDKSIGDGKGDSLAKHIKNTSNVSQLKSFITLYGQNAHAKKFTKAALNREAKYVAHVDQNGKVLKFISK